MTHKKQKFLPVNETISSDQTSGNVSNRSLAHGRLNRRALLCAVGGGFTAGCLGDSRDESDDSGEDASDVLPDIPRVADPPAAVYVPTHRETMAHLPTIQTGEYALSPMLTYPHRFWTVTGNSAEEVLPVDRRGVHLMVTPWDPETEQVLPIDSGATFRIYLHGDLIETVTPWPMISQTMGFHFGDNIPLPVDDTYSVEIELPPISSRKEGDFEGKFEESTTGSFQFVYDEDLRYRLIENVEYLDEAVWGAEGALEPLAHGDVVPVEGGVMDDETNHTGDHDHSHDDMGDGHDHDAPFSTVPEPSAYPGTHLGTPKSGDALIVVQSIPDEDVVIVSPRTPYNHVPLADMAISVTGSIEGELEQTIDPTLGLHYRIAGALDPGDSIALQFDAPPQVSRHAGFETAFLDMEEVEVTVPQ